MMETRLVDLELRYMQLERQLSELNDVVYQQQKQMDGMRTELVALRARVHALSEPGSMEAEESLEAAKPPHY